MPKILVVEDDQTAAETVEQWLKNEQFTVEIASRGSDALQLLQMYDYDAIVLDWQLPEISGIEILRRFRASGGITPVIMLTGKGELDDKEVGFNAGADDYIKKPFHPRELVMRIRAVLRRPAVFANEALSVRHVVLHTNTRQVLVCGKEVQLQPMEFALLEFLMRHPDQTFSTETLLRRIWQSDKAVCAASIYTCTARLRKKLDMLNEPSLITTVHGVGYRLDSRAEAPAK